MGSSERDQIGDEVIHPLGGQSRFVAHHGRALPLLVEGIELVFPERVDLACKIPELDREPIFINSCAGQGAPILCDDLEQEEAAGQRGLGLDERLPQVGRAPARADVVEDGAQDATLAAQSVTHPAVERGVHAFATACISGISSGATRPSVFT